MDDTVWYFAYGSNLDPDRFRSRICHWLEMRPARLVGFRLRFSDDVCSEGGAGAVIIPDAGRSVHGAVFRITDEQMAAMDREEFADEHVGAAGAARRTVTVQTDQGPLNAEVYTINTDSFGPPSPEYLGHITRGLLAVGFDAEVVAEVERIAASEGS